MDEMLALFGEVLLLKAQSLSEKYTPFLETYSPLSEVSADFI